MAKKLADLKVGERIKFGRYSVESEEPHDIIWIKVHRDNTFMAEHIEDYRAFDAKEPTSSSEYQRGYGNNNYMVSNIRQFLNSADKIWFAEQHEHDASPSVERVYDGTHYENHRGFLNLFTDEEYEAIEYTDVETVVPRMGVVHMEQKVFLPSITNIFGYKNNDIMEGQYWDYFKVLCRHRRAIPTNDAIDNTTCTGFTLRHRSAWYYYLRSAQCASSCEVHYVSDNGNFYTCYAYRGVIGLRPALKLNPNIIISGENNDGFPVLDLPKTKEIEFSLDETLNILNM